MRPNLWVSQIASKSIQNGNNIWHAKTVIDKHVLNPKPFSKKHWTKNHSIMKLIWDACIHVSTFEHCVQWIQKWNQGGGLISVWLVNSITLQKGSGKKLKKKLKSVWNINNANLECGFHAAPGIHAEWRQYCARLWNGKRRVKVHVVYTLPLTVVRVKICNTFWEKEKRPAQRLLQPKTTISKTIKTSLLANKAEGHGFQNQFVD